MSNPTPGPWTNNDGLVNGVDSRARFAGTPSIDIFDASEWPAELSDEAHANARLIAAAPELLDVLVAIKRHGELGCVDAGSLYTGGKKPAAKDVWQFPRHLLTDLDAALSKATRAEVRS